MATLVSTDMVSISAEILSYGGMKFKLPFEGDSSFKYIGNFDYAISLT